MLFFKRKREIAGFCWICKLPIDESQIAEILLVSLSEEDGGRKIICTGCYKRSLKRFSNRNTNSHNDLI